MSMNTGGGLSGTYCTLISRAPFSHRSNIECFAYHELEIGLRRGREIDDKLAKKITTHKIEQN